MIKRTGLITAIVVGVGLLSACANEENYAVAVRSWQGASERQLFNIWGYPNRIQKLDNGHKLLVYRTVNKGTYPTTTTPGYTSVDSSGGHTTVTQSGGTTMGGGSYDFRCLTWFEVNRNGRVTNTSFRGNGCVASDSFMRSRRRM
jgi:hypothetical protein